MSLTAPYIWIMVSGVYDVLQIYDIDGSASYFDIYCNGTKVYTLDKYDDISYVTIEDLELESKVTPGLDYFSIGVIAYDEDRNESEKSNVVLWYRKGEFDNNGNDPDIWSPFQETSTFYFYLDGNLVEKVARQYIFSSSDALNYNGTLSVRLSPISSMGILIEMANSRNNTMVSNYSYNYDVPISSVTITPSTISSSNSSLSIYVYAISGDERYTFKRLCYNNDLIDAGNIGFRHHGKRDITCNDCLSFISDINDFTLTATNVEWDGTLEYSTDRINWTVWDGSEIGSVNQKLYLRGYNNTRFYTSSGVRFNLSAPAGCYGNINTLLNYDNPPETIKVNNCYSNMFYNCSNLTTAPDLPATTLVNSCYYSMFYNCSSLTTAPDLPATTLADYCYSNMFRGCSNLTTAPDLPATTLANSCYYGMFYNCSSLTTAPDLPATTLANYCYSNMFYNCSNLTTAPDLPATTLANYCYQYMFRGCSSLTTAPDLPATTLANYCYSNMFYNCSNLTTAPDLPATTLYYYCYSEMFYNCSNLTTAPDLPATTLANNCYQYMFRGCTNLTAAPELPATTLADYCYYSMFYNCSSLTTAPDLPATTLANYCYYSMFSGCRKIKLSSAETDEYTQEYRIPTSGEGTTATNALQYMFNSTGGTFTGTPTINTTYYLHSSNTIV